ncbi:MAG: ThuA domain-containing protein [Terriglobales bacterium]|jgi:YVTN family beta-propeller protein
MASSLLACSEYRSRCCFGLAVLLSLVPMSASMARPSDPKLEQKARFQVIAFYSASAEPDHVRFAEDALKFFSALAARDDFTFDSTDDWANLNASYLKKYQVVIWLNDAPTNAEQRLAFQQYIETGGAWLGFHAAGYNDKDTNWPWFVDFLGGAVFHINSWPPLPARLTVDERNHPATANLPDAFVAPANEWYVWKPSPRLNKDVRVLVTFDPSNYPLGLKDVLTGGDLPVVWTNTKYKMIYMNMGHGDKIFASAIQNKLIEDATISLGTPSGRADRPPATGLEISPRGIVENYATRKVYAVNSAGGSVTVIDGASGSTKVVKVGTEPEAIAVNPITNKIYVGNSGSGTVSVIDGATDAVTATVPVGDLPYVVAVDPVRDKVYVSKTFSNTTTVIDGKTNQTSILKAGVQADAIAMDAMTNRIYMTSYEDSKVTVIDGRNDNVTTIDVDTHIWGIAANSVTKRIYLTGSGSAKVWAIDEKNNSVAPVDTGEIPCAIAIDQAANRIYVANYGSDSVTVIDGATNSVLATVRVGEHPQALALNSTTHRVYVANTHSNNVTVIDGTLNSVVATVNTGNGPYAIAIDATANKAYVATMAGENLTMIDGNTLTGTPVAPPTRQ